MSEFDGLAHGSVHSVELVVQNYYQIRQFVKFKPDFDAVKLIEAY